MDRLGPPTRPRLHIEESEKPFLQSTIELFNQRKLAGILERVKNGGMAMSPRQLDIIYDVIDTMTENPDFEIHAHALQCSVVVDELRKKIAKREQKLERESTDSLDFNSDGPTAVEKSPFETEA